MGVLLLAAGLLLPAAPATAEVHPQTSYLALTTIMGAAGGGALGASLGGLSRNTTESDIRPFLRWGSAGGVLGGILGRAVGMDLISRSRGHGTAPTTSSREIGACLGALIGEAAGLGLSSALHQPVSRDSREVWAGIALGAVVGAAAGYLLPPMSFLAPPPEASDQQRAENRQRRRIDPRVPGDEGGRFAPLPDSGAMPDRDPGQTARLAGSLLALEQHQLLEPRRITPRDSAPLLTSDLTPERVSSLAASVMNLCLLEGALLGGALGAVVGGRDADLSERIALGGSIGLVAGWSTASAMTRPWKEGERLERGRPARFADLSESLREGREFSGVLLGGLLGTVAGGAVGAVLANSLDDYGDREIAGAALGGNVLGLFLGRVLTRSD